MVCLPWMGHPPWVTWLLGHADYLHVSEVFSLLQGPSGSVLPSLAPIATAEQAGITVFQQ